MLERLPHVVRLCWFYIDEDPTPKPVLNGYLDDLHVVATPEGLLKGKAIRRLTDPWRPTWLFMVQEKPFQKLTRKATLKNLRFGAPPTPKPVAERQEKLPYEAIDYDAKDVIEYARTHPPSPVSDAGMPETEENKRSHEGEGFPPRSQPSWR